MDGFLARDNPRTHMNNFILTAGSNSSLPAASLLSSPMTEAMQGEGEGPMPTSAKPHALSLVYAPRPASTPFIVHGAHSTD